MQNVCEDFSDLSELSHDMMQMPAEGRPVHPRAMQRAWTPMGGCISASVSFDDG